MLNKVTVGSILKTGKCRLRRFLYAVSLILLAGSTIADDKPDLVVVYPVVREPFAALYRDYILGINESAGHRIREYQINDSNEEISRKIVGGGIPDVYIALGNKSVKIVNSLESQIPIVAVVTNRKYESDIAGGILLKPSADVYLKNLLDIYEKVDEIFVVYNPEYDKALVEDAKKYASAHGITVRTFPATSIREAATGYQSILKNAKAYSAVWLLPDNSFLDRSLLSTVLDVAWDKKLIVFSSNPLFVKHGALFAIYPDNKGVGLTLGKIAHDVHMDNSGGLQPLRDIRLAVNQRTLNHLGIDLSPLVMEKIELMLPGR